MKTPDDVSAMLRLRSLGWGSKRIAAELGCARNTVRHWLAHGDWRPCASPSRSTKLDGLSDWLGERFRRHAGNADVVRQELAREKSISVSLRTVERAVAPLRRELIAAARATVRFETQDQVQVALMVIPQSTARRFIISVCSVCPNVRSPMFSKSAAARLRSR